MAPEVVELLLNNKTSCNMFKADVYSLGLCLLYSITHMKFQSRERRNLDTAVYKEVI